jgi:hypothetical protein
VNNALLQQSHFHDFIDIHRCGNITAAMADKYTNSTHFLPPILPESAHQQLLRRFIVQKCGDLVGRKTFLTPLTDQNLTSGIDQLAGLHIPGAALNTGKAAQAFPCGHGVGQGLHIIVDDICNELMGLNVHLVKGGAGGGAFTTLHAL